MKEIVREKKYLALGIIALFALFFFYAAMPLLLGISGAAILYVLLKPLYTGLNSRVKSRMACAMAVLLLSFVLIIIPFFIIIYFAVADIVIFLGDQQNIDAVLSFIAIGGQGMGLAQFAEQHLTEISNLATGFSFLAIDWVVGVSINLVVMYIILYYLLTENKRASEAIMGLLPFNEKNSKRLAAEFHNIIRATFITNGAVALIVGVLLAGGLYLLGAENIIFWAVLGTVTAIIPVIGIQIIWIPFAIFYIFHGEYVSAAAIVVWGAFLSYIADGYFRQLVQSRIGSIHPFISLVGLIIGVTYFGITGIIIGPLLISLFVLTAQMFREEYLPEWDK